MSEPGAITVQSAVAFLLATWPRRIALGLLLLVPVVVGAIGGFARAEPPPRTVEAGVATDTGGYLVVPQYYFVSDTVDAPSSLDDGERWIGAVVQLTNQGDEPIYLTFGDETFRIPAELIGADDLAGAAGALRLDTGADLGDAQPGMTYEVALLWRSTQMAEPPAELTLTLNRTAFVEWSIEAGYRTWRSTGESYDVTLPLGEAPLSILEEEDA